jgi:hypothetical protein
VTRVSQSQSIALSMGVRCERETHNSGMGGSEEVADRQTDIHT